jgi:hypothetical protein
MPNGALIVRQLDPARDGAGAEAISPSSWNLANPRATDEAMPQSGALLSQIPTLPSPSDRRSGMPEVRSTHAGPSDGTPRAETL